MSVYHPRPNTHYVRRSQQRRQQAQTPMGRWLAAGVGGAALLIGGYFAAMHFLQGRASVAQDVPTVFEKRHQVLESGLAHGGQQGQFAEKERVIKQLDASPQARFQFYEALPRAEVEVEAAPLPVKLTQPVQVLAGTFTDRQRALREQARLKRQGFDLTMVPVQRKGRTLYQLRSAVIDNRLDMIRLRNGLQKAGARVLVIRVPNQSQP